MYHSYSLGYWGGGPQQQRRQEQQPRQKEEEKEEKEQQQLLLQRQQQQQHHPYLASSLFESNAFYNLGRVLSMEQQHHQQHQYQQQEEQQGGGDTEGEVHQNVILNGLAESAPVPPVQRATVGWGGWGGGAGGGAGHEEQHGQGEVVEERDGSYLVCSIRPQVRRGREEEKMCKERVRRKKRRKREEEAACGMPHTSWLLSILSAGLHAISQTGPLILLLIPSDPHLLAFLSTFLPSLLFP